VAATLAVGLPAGAAAMYAARHGADPLTVMAVNDVRNYSYFVSLLMLGAQAITLGIAAITDGRFTKWIGWGGVATGVVCIIGVPGHFLNVGAMVWFVWWIGVAVTFLRAARANQAGAGAEVAARN
ncbi:MAG: hypothetical protein ACRDPI_03690, partial [Nocardioidaceae bacterium]